ncbi:MAG: urea ABC transporter substrate-binding protein [Burkholderiales bacterium]
MSKYNRRDFLLTTAAAMATGMLPGVVLGSKEALAADTVKVGILHSLTGTLAINEAAVVEAEKLAIEEINAAGGVLGKQVIPIVEDGASDWPTFTEKAKKLLERDKVAAVFGCYTSASRKAVLPVFERNNGLLYYPTYYEGMEESKNIFYTGQEATQQTIPAVEWLVKNKGKTFYLIGSDYVWPRTTNKIAKKVLASLGAKTVGEDYIPLGNTEFSTTINKIKAQKPDVILATVVGGSNVAFFKQLRSAGFTGNNQTLMTLAVTEDEMSGIGPENVVGFYSSMGYFQSLKNPANEKFVKAFKAKYGQNRVIGDTMECGYISPFLWKEGVEKAKTFAVQNVVSASYGLGMVAPEGDVKIDPNHHLWKHARIGRARADGQFDIVYETPLIKPNPFPKL